jgi:hypothetical protein
MDFTIDGGASESNDGDDRATFIANQLRQPPLFR